VTPPAQNSYAVARDVNPDAGTHAISGNPAEIAAAEAATRKSWKEFPYYAQRYGERGWRFSLSDSGWIATLCDLSPADARDQVLWLGGLLAARGMPRYLLERHLEHLHDELTRAVPDKSASYAALKNCAAALREIRESHVPAASFESMAQSFEHRVKPCKARVVNMGRMLVAALADERAAVANAIESLEPWATDPSRFDSMWIDAVRETIATARAKAS
jgi:hypothetical protein